ncbi:MAG: hypothetical protein ABI831_19175 [Betaproteobacteria bacterium]
MPPEKTRDRQPAESGKTNDAPGEPVSPQPVVLRWWQDWKVMVVLWVAMLGLIWLGERYQVNRSVTAGTVVVFGLLSNAFAWLLAVVAMIPVIGPLIVKILSVGVIWLLNALGYLVSFIAIRRGYAKDVLTYRGVTIALIIGIVIGYVLGKLL